MSAQSLDHLTALLHSTDDDDPTVTEALRDLGFQSAFQPLIRGMLHRTNNHMQGVYYALPYVLGDESTDEEMLNRLRSVARDGSDGTFDAMQQLTSVVSARAKTASPTSVRDVLREVVTWAGYHREGGDIEFVVDSVDDLPAADVSFIDAATCLTLVVNNAIEHVQETTSPTVTMTLRRGEDGLVAITVSDNGPPISQTNRGRLFDTGKSTKDGHAGLGLPIAACLAGRVQGRLDVSQAPDPLQFRLAFPAV